MRLHSRVENQCICITRRTGNISATYQSYGHRENRNTSTHVNILGQHECWYRRSNQKLLDDQVTWSKKKAMLHEMPGKQWESIRADIFTSNNKHYLCIADYKSKFSVVKQVDGFNTDDPIKHARWSFQNMPSEIVSVVGSNTVSEKF